MKAKDIATLAGCCLFAAACARAPKNLVPDTPSKAPDYFCTWNLQGYVACYNPNSAVTREAMNERSLFGDGKYEHWTDCYPSIRQDLYFVMDDSWDTPKDDNSDGGPNMGSVRLDEGRFPSFTGSDEERLRQLTERIKEKGWKGAGGWICAQKAGRYDDQDETAFWTRRLQEANNAGFGYWKVDWGRRDRDGEWRRKLSALARQHAPQLWIEHAFHNEFIEFSDVFRTYDVENVTAQPVTIQRVCDLLPFRAGEGKGIINCEDEPYIAAGLGCAIGIMRHPFAGNLPDGTQDITFPPVGRDIKRRLDEVVRGVRWHRIAEPFGVDGQSYQVDTARLEDYWTLGENETWNRSRKPGDVMKASAPARASRGMALPAVSDTLSPDRPFILASRYPNGATAIASIGRALHREYVTKRVAVEIPIQQAEAPVGVFGYFEKVTLAFAPDVPLAQYKVYAQDLAANEAEDVTAQVQIEGNRLTLPGGLLARVGLSAATSGDLSVPGLVVQFFKE